MKKLLRYLVNTILFVVIFSIPTIFIMGYAVSQYGTRPNALSAFGPILGLLIAYILVKRINKSNLWASLFDEKEGAEEKEKEVKASNLVEKKAKENKKEQDVFISKGWIRLHKIFGLLGGLLLHIPFGLFSGAEDLFSLDGNSKWILICLWPLIYFYLIKTFLITKKFNNGVISEIWFNLHIIISVLIFLFMSIIYIPLFGDFMNIAATSGYTVVDGLYERKAIFSTGCLLFGLIFSLLYWVSICLTVWVIDGFRNEDR